MNSIHNAKGAIENMKNKIEKTVLVTGGAGFIGSNVVAELARKKYKVVVVDNFSNSRKKYIKSVQKAFPQLIDLIEMDILNKKKLEDVFAFYQIDVVVHLAGKKYVQESFEKQDEYYLNNITATQILLDVMKNQNVKKLVFSSSITVYGNCKKFPISETKKRNPLSPYAKQKVEGEKLIKAWSKSQGNSAIVLRLSNPVGANVDMMLGEDSITKRQGLVPYLIENGIQNKGLVLNGNDHKTRDGTTIRDYVHVLDVASAFVQAVETGLNKSYEICNIGTGGEGFTVLEILNQVEKCLKKKMNYSFGPKKKGDAAIIVSNVNKAKEILKHESKRSLKCMIESQYKFQKSKN